MRQKKCIKSSSNVTVQIAKRKRKWLKKCDVKLTNQRKDFFCKKCPRDKTCALKPF